MSQQIPQDPMMLMSFINMKLRDEYSNLDELCQALDMDKSKTIETLAKFGFEYNEEENKFW